MNKNLITLGIILMVLVILISPFISFNNTMVNLKNTKQSELDTTKTTYSQCLIKITETNSEAKAYKQDILDITKQTGDNLKAFSEQMMTWLNTKLMPELTPELRINVQKEIIACRNAYSNSIDQNLKPLYTTYNNSIETFPGSFYNLFLGYKREDLNMPKTEAVQKMFETGIDKELDLK